MAARGAPRPGGGETGWLKDMQPSGRRGDTGAGAAAELDQLAAGLAAAQLAAQPQWPQPTQQDLSYQYWSSACLNYQDRLADGFYEVVGDFPEAAPTLEDFPLLPALQRLAPHRGREREVILFDRQSDPGLQDAQAEAEEAVAEARAQGRGLLSCHRALARAVAGRLGGPQPGPPGTVVANSFEMITAIKARTRSEVVPIGSMYMGAARHRAVLYKFLADLFGLECRVIKGRFYADNDQDAKVVVAINGEELFMDLLVCPGVTRPVEEKLALRVSRSDSAAATQARAALVAAAVAAAEPAHRSSPAVQQRSTCAVGPTTQQADGPLAPPASQAAAAGGAAPLTAAPPIAAPIEQSQPPPVLTLEEAMHLAAHAALAGGQDWDPQQAGAALPLTSGSGSLPAPQHPLPVACPDHMSPSPFSTAPPSTSSELQPRWNASSNGLPSPQQPHSRRSSMPRELSDVLAARTSLGRGASISELEELGPPTLVSDETGQQFLIQPVRASAEMGSMTLGLPHPQQAQQDHGMVPTISELLQQHLPSSSSRHSLTGAGSRHGGTSAWLEAPDYSPVGAHPSTVRASLPVYHYKSSFGVPSSGAGGSDSSGPVAHSPGWSGKHSADGAGGGRPNLGRLSGGRNERSWHGGYLRGGIVGELYHQSLQERADSGGGDPLPSLVRMSVPVEWEERQGLRSRQEASTSDVETGRNSPPRADPTHLASRSSGGSVPFPTLPPEALAAAAAAAAERQGSGLLASPFGLLQTGLSGSFRSDNVDGSSPKSSLLSPQRSGNLSRQHTDEVAAASEAVLSHPLGQRSGSSSASSGRPFLSPVPSLTAVVLPSAATRQVSTRQSVLSNDTIWSMGSGQSDEEGWEIDESELTLGPRIGIGSFGEVYRGQWRQTDVAIKRFLDQEAGAGLVEDFRKEISIMKRLRHPNIVQFIGACTRVPNLCIVTHFLPRGSLFKLLHRTPAFQPDERRRLQMALDVAKGMNYLHTCRPPIIHRDLKSPNLLVDKDLTVKVCDFGLSRVRRGAVLTSTSQAGTPEWTAPEVLRSQPCNESTDVYSFGVILWELLTGQEPWGDKTAIQVVGSVGWSGERLPVPDTAPPSMQALVARCFGESQDRPAFSEIITILKRRLQALGPVGPPRP